MDGFGTLRGEGLLSSSCSFLAFAMASSCTFARSSASRMAASVAALTADAFARASNPCASWLGIGGGGGITGTLCASSKACIRVPRFFDAKTLSLRVGSKVVNGWLCAKFGCSL